MLPYVQAFIGDRNCAASSGQTAFHRHATPAAFAAELDKQWSASLRLKGSATQPIASTALMRKTSARL
jgi:hypothetical protein